MYKLSFWRLFISFLVFRLYFQSRAKLFRLFPAVSMNITKMLTKHVSVLVVYALIKQEIFYY